MCTWQKRESLRALEKLEEEEVGFVTDNITAGALTNPGVIEKVPLAALWIFGVCCVVAAVQGA